MIEPAAVSSRRPLTTYPDFLIILNDRCKTRKNQDLH